MLSEVWYSNHMTTNPNLGRLALEELSTFANGTVFDVLADELWFTADLDNVSSLAQVLCDLAAGLLTITDGGGDDVYRITAEGIAWLAS